MRRLGIDPTKTRLVRSAVAAREGRAPARGSARSWTSQLVLAGLQHRAVVRPFRIEPPIGCASAQTAAPGGGIGRTRCIGVMPDAGGSARAVRSAAGLGWRAMTTDATSEVLCVVSRRPTSPLPELQRVLDLTRLFQATGASEARARRHIISQDHAGGSVAAGGEARDAVPAFPRAGRARDPRRSVRRCCSACDRRSRRRAAIGGRGGTNYLRRAALAGTVEGGRDRTPSPMHSPPSPPTRMSSSSRRGAAVRRPRTTSSEPSRLPRRRAPRLPPSGRRHREAADITEMGRRS